MIPVNKKKLLLLLASFLVFASPAISQGCSDAGFCTIGNLAAHQSDTGLLRRHQLKLLLPVGASDVDVIVFAPGLEYSYILSQKISLQGKLTGNYATGNLGKVWGPGDFFATGTYVFSSEKRWKPSLTLGAKLPLNQSNISSEGRSYPMQYQSSLGTVDLIAGFALVSARFQFAAGWQQPLTGINLNHFLPVYWNKEEAKAYPSTNDFRRKGDVLVRGGYEVRLPSKWHLNAGLLAIYHLGEDSYIDANVSNRPINIKGSEGLTLNATASFTRALGNRVGIGLTGGVPLIVRDVRPDGLTRSWLISPEITFKF